MNIGILGAGNIGANLARLFAKAGHDVRIANSRGPQSLTDLVAGIGEVEQVVLEESSHMPFWEQRDAYMTAVDDFLRRHD